VFTGLIKYTGTLAAREGTRLRIEVPAELRAVIAEGDSVAVNGVCLTAVRLGGTVFEADLLESTLRDTTLGSIPVGATVNLEPALRAGDPMGGHIVQGHVDGATTLLRRQAAAATENYEFELPKWLGTWIVPKGSICIDGVSLTVQALDAGSFTVELIPETVARTNLGSLQVGQKVN